MGYENWNNKVNEFKVVDVRGVAGNFFPGLKKQEEQLVVGDGLHIVQTFEPIPLYEAMDQPVQLRSLIHVVSISFSTSIVLIAIKLPSANFSST